MKHILAAWMRDRPGVLNRVSGLLRRRNFNIDSLQVSHSEEPGISRMTFVVDGDDRTLDQVQKQLIKLVDVTRVENLSTTDLVARELALIRIGATPAQRQYILQLVEIFRAQVVDVAHSSLLLQIVGTADKIEALIELLEGYRIMEMVRTGPVAIRRSTSAERRAMDGAETWAKVTGRNGAGP